MNLVFFELAVFVRQGYSLFSLSVGKLEPALGVDKNIFLFYNIEILVANDVAEYADFSVGFVNARTFDIEKYKIHQY